MTMRSRLDGSALKRTLYLTVKTLVSLAILLVLQGIPGQPANLGATTAFAATTVAESNDFATRVLRDPWDMSEFTDISLGLNNSGQTNYLQNYQVANGIFSAQSTSLQAGMFNLLFPGYRINPNMNAINIGKYGVNYPIPSSTYHCLYVAMRVNSSPPYDFGQVFWFANTHLNDGASPWGYSNGISISPSIWKLYSIDLAKSSYPAGSSWTSNATWQGLQFKATGQANVTFAIDWARLTDCAAVNTTITWSGSASYLWLVSASTGNAILAKTGLSGTSTSLDTQGLAAGTYTVCLSTSSSSCNRSGTPNPSSLTINQAPIATFNRPSPYSGVDYATQNGNPWDFSDAADMAETRNFANISMGGGVLNMRTDSGPSVGADPMIFLNNPQAIANGSRYRYLSYRLYTQWPLQNVPQGMIVRWSWWANGCEVITHDIPFDVGWQTYSVDLSDPFNGSIEPPPSWCPPGITWSTSSNITHLRFDPTENILGQTLFQQLDWIRLTEVDKVTHGTPFPVQISLNKSSQEVSLTYYYTTNPQQPTQHIASQYAVSQPPPAGSHRQYLPLALYSTGLATSGLTFLWNTSSVVPGTYYVCVTANDTKNQSTSCSDAPVQVN